MGEACALRGGEGAHDFRRGAQNHGTGRDAGAWGDEGVGTDEALLADDGSVEEGGAHAHEAFVAHGAGMDVGGVADGDAAADDAWEVIGEVEDGVILDVGLLADLDAVDIPAQDGSVPDAGSVPEGDVAEDDGGACDIDMGAEAWGGAEMPVELGEERIHGREDSVVWDAGQGVGLPTRTAPR